ncbi:MAG: HAMP domain-containing histidine kinase [Zoogloeaceae bacterium]|jgi:signal transduction histidine kinase|nr:HAMP domain-containing histidine kinase [Zoogloeaceae bacterium]
MPERMTRQPFFRRIVIAFTLMTFVVSGMMSLAMFYAIRSIEQDLVSRSLDKTLDRVLNEDLSEGKMPDLNTDTWFFASDRPEYAIPEQLAEATPGFSEIVTDDEAYYIFVREIGEQRYILMQDQHEFERYERNIFKLLFAGFLLTVAGAWGLGRLTAKRVMAPVSRLAEEVRQRESLRTSTTPLAEHYANDEIGRLAEAFDTSLQRLGEALERERLFTSDVSHELRTPLMIIATSCELLAADNLNPREREQIERIARAAEEMRSLAETFLMLARSSGNRRQGTEDSMGTLVDIAGEQYARWLPEMQNKGLEFGMSIEAAPAALPLNAVLLRAVLGNLLRNAWHYTEQGWVRLALEADGFRVEDSGIGIPEQEKEQVFQPFTRGAQARGEGLGLGLSLVRRICKNQGWDITLDALPEGGSRFRVRLR